MDDATSASHLPWPILPPIPETVWHSSSSTRPASPVTDHFPSSPHYSPPSPEYSTSWIPTITPTEHSPHSPMFSSLSPYHRHYASSPPRAFQATPIRFLQAQAIDTQLRRHHNKTKPSLDPNMSARHQTRITRKAAHNLTQRLLRPALRAHTALSTPLWTPLPRFMRAEGWRGR